MVYNESRKLSTMKYMKKLRVEKPFEARKKESKTKSRTFIRKYAEVEDLRELISFAEERISELESGVDE